MARKSAKSAADRDEMIRWLFENSRDLMHVIGPDGRFKLTNDAWEAAHRLGRSGPGRRAGGGFLPRRRHRRRPAEHPRHGGRRGLRKPDPYAAQKRRVLLVRRAHPEGRRRLADRQHARHHRGGAPGPRNWKTSAAARRMLSEAAGVGGLVVRAGGGPHRLVQGPADPDRLHRRGHRDARALPHPRPPGRPQEDDRGDDPIGPHRRTGATATPAEGRRPLAHLSRDLPDRAAGRRRLLPARPFRGHHRAGRGAGRRPGAASSRCDGPVARRR